MLEFLMMMIITTATTATVVGSPHIQSETLWHTFKISVIFFLKLRLR